MQKTIAFLFFAVILFSCTSQVKQKDINITGKILSGNVEEIKLSLFETDVAFEENTYFAKVNRDSTYSLKIITSKPLSGTIHLGNYYHEIFLMPGDNIYIVTEEDTIQYSGKGAERNTFLYETLEKGNYGNYTSVFRSEKNLNEVAEFVSGEYSKITQLLNDLKINNGLEKEFINWLKISSKVNYEEFMNYYPMYYLIKNKVDLDTIDLPKSFQEMMVLKNFVDDSKLASRNYFVSLNNLVYSTAHKISKKDSIISKNAVENIMFDSLQGKSRDYAIAYILKGSFSRNMLDTVIYKRFNKEITNVHAKEIVERSYQKYLEKQKLINAPLNEEFSLTQLVDDNENELTFGEMLSKYKGKIVYLDIWSLGCGPCIENMPKSKTLKDKLQNRPIEFVYITVDGKSDKLWDKVYEVSFSKENHYRFKKSFDARILKYLEINWVPNYMLFDKDNNLISYTAVRPDSPNFEEEIMKYLN